MWWGGFHWWWSGPVLMCVGMLVCMAVMALMMGHGRGMGGMGRFWGQNRSGRDQAGTSGQILDERLARGEVDIDEYRRIQQTLAKGNSPAGSEERVGSPL
jgi:putative membrane protein